MNELDFSDKSLWIDGYQTRDGRAVRILTNDALGVQPIVALIKKGIAECARKFSANGLYFVGNGNSKCDLIRKPVKRKGWVNVYICPSHSGRELGCLGELSHAYPTREACDASNIGRNRIACIEIEFEEGQGL